MRKTGLCLLLVLAAGCAAPGAPKGRSARPAVEHVLLDTDGAEFWDDGAALAMLLSEPSVRLKGISLVFGNHFPRNGVAYIGRVLDASGASGIPVHLGASQPLQNSKLRLQALEKEVGASFWKGAWSREKIKLVPAPQVAPRKKSAVSFLIEALRASPEPVTLVALGPLTNVAEAIARDKRIIPKIHRLLVMGGAVRAPGNTTRTAELNFLLDPEAAQAVLSAGLREILVFPLDLSNEGKIGRLKFGELTSVPGPFGALLAEQMGKKFEDPSYKLEPWDTMVAAYLLDPGYVTSSEELPLTVSTELGPSYGSVELKDGAPKVRVMTGMDFGRYFAAVKRGLTRAPR